MKVIIKVAGTRGVGKTTLLNKVTQFLEKEYAVHSQEEIKKEPLNSHTLYEEKIIVLRIP